MKKFSLKNRHIMNQPVDRFDAFWQYPPPAALSLLKSAEDGLSQAEAERRLRARTKTRKRVPAWVGVVRLFLGQFSSPLVLLLVFAVVLSSSLGQYRDAALIFGILFLTGVMGFWQEYRASRIVHALQARVHTSTTVLRGGRSEKIRLEEVVPGDITLLTAGDVVPGDCLLLQGRDLHVNESALTGESFPAEKEPGVVAADAAMADRTNTLFEGSSVVSGEATALVVRSGEDTEFGKIAARMGRMDEASAFQIGIRQFGYLLMRMTFVLSAGILISNLFFRRPVVESILFSIALAVGLAPELLPAILITTLSAGAMRMAKDKVIVKKLASIQDLGAINILCSDKTGTLTVGSAQVHAMVDVTNRPSDKVRLYAYLNAVFETGFTNPLDEAIRQIPGMDTAGYVKTDEVPFDFLRKRLSIVVANAAKQHLMLTKGALVNVLAVCSHAEMPDGKLTPIAAAKPTILKEYETQSAQGLRTIGLAWKDVSGDPVINKDDECEMIFLGLILLEDPPKPGILETVRYLSALGIRLKIVTGDNRLAAAHLAAAIGLENTRLLNGPDLAKMSDAALAKQAQEVDLFAEVEPQQKDRLIRLLRTQGDVVGYLGDGINDAGALKAADVGISVESAVDVAKEAADIVLLEKDLQVLQNGILDGRRTYINTLKYIFITTSANFGNMFSLAAVSLFLPWLPLLPKQILALNLISDVPALTIASDRVDEEQLKRPKRWDIGLIRRFMIVFGVQSSLFDCLTFGALLLIFHAGERVFQTGWFVESVLTEVLALLIIRTTRPALRSCPSKWLLWTSIGTASLTIGLPYLPVGQWIGLEPLPLTLLGFMIAIAALYGVLVETTKRRFFRNAQL